MARVTFMMDFPTLTKEDLVALVVANDDAASSVNGEPGIAPEFVRGSDVVSLWAMGDLPNVQWDLRSTIED